MGNVTKSQQNNVTSPNGNSLAVFVDGITGVIKVKDIMGNIQPLSDFISVVGSENLQEVTDNGNETTNAIKSSAEIGSFLDTTDETLGASRLSSGNLYLRAFGGTNGLGIISAENISNSLSIVILQIPNKTTGIYTIATTNDIPPAITIDATPTDGSSNAVSSNGVFDGLALKQDIVSGVSDTEIGYLNGVTSAIQTQFNARCEKLFNLTPQVTLTGTTAKTIIATYFIPANTFTNGDFLIFSAMVTKVANISITTHTLEVNTTNTLTGATIISTIGFNTSNFMLKFKREIALNGGNGYIFHPSASVTNDQTINALGNTPTSFTYNLTADLYLFVTCQLTNATDNITYRGISITKN